MKIYRMNRHQLIPFILRKVSLELAKHSETKSVYRENTGFLTDADIIAHNIIEHEILKYFPNDYILSEESDEKNLLEINKSEYSWIADPICGTTNYLYEIPFYAHAVSLVKDNDVVASGVYDPKRDELFFSDGKDFFLNDSKILLNNVKDISESLISFNTNQSNFEKKEFQLNNILKKISPPICRRVHILESANLELAYVAAGRIDVYLNPCDKPWDIAAARLFLTTANASYKIINDSEKNIIFQEGIIAAGSNTLLLQVEKALNL